MINFLHVEAKISFDFKIVLHKDQKNVEKRKESTNKNKWDFFSIFKKFIPFLFIALYQAEIRLENKI